MMRINCPTSLVLRRKTDETVNPVEDYQKAGETFWPKYWYVAKELGEDAKPEDVLKILESIGTVALRLKMEEKA